METPTKLELAHRMQVVPSSPLRGAVSASLPGDKSLSHRAALFAAMAEGVSHVDNFLVSGVTRAMLAALTALDISWRLDDRLLTVHGIGLRMEKSDEPVYINCGNSGTTMRLLAGALAAWDIAAILDGSDGLRRRPMGRIVTPLRQMGVDISATGGCAPLEIKPVGGLLEAIRYDMPVASAQVKSCLILAALSAAGVTRIREPGPSRDHSERMLKSMGVVVECERQSGEYPFITTIYPPEPRRLTPLDIRLPGDFSAAAFLIVAALVTPGSEITIQGVG